MWQNCVLKSTLAIILYYIILYYIILYYIIITISIILSLYDGEPTGIFSLPRCRQRALNTNTPECLSLLRSP